MTKIWVNDAFVPVTLAKVIPQEIVRYKTEEKDGYTAAVVGTGKKEVANRKGTKTVYSTMSEFKVSPDFIAAHEAGKALTVDLVDGVETVSATGNAIGKGFQGMVKRCHVKGM